MKQRIPIFDNAKGILILLVVLGHCLNYANPRYDIPLYIMASSFISSFHMPAFFLITGMLFNKEKWIHQTWSSFILRKVNTLVLPFLFFELVAVLYKHFILQTISISEGLYYILCQNYNIGADWFLPAMFLANLLFFGYIKHENKLIGLIFCVVFLCSTWFLPKGAGWNVLLRSMIAFALIFIGYQLKQLFFYRFEQKKFNILMGVLAFVITSIVAALSLFFATNDLYAGVVNRPVLFVLGGMSGLYFVLIISENIHSKCLSWIGENSLTIMGTHQLVLYTIHANSSILWIVFAFVFIMIIEVIVICFVNRFCPFLVGKRSLKRHGY